MDIIGDIAMWWLAFFFGLNFLVNFKKKDGELHPLWKDLHPTAYLFLAAYFIGAVYGTWKIISDYDEKRDDKRTITNLRIQVKDLDSIMKTNYTNLDNSLNGFGLKIDRNYNAVSVKNYITNNNSYPGMIKQRHVTKQDLARIAKEMLYKKAVQFTCIGTDVETLNYAKEIRDTLDRRGYKRWSFMSEPYVQRDGDDKIIKDTFVIYDYVKAVGGKGEGGSEPQYNIIVYPATNTFR